MKIEDYILNVEDFPQKGIQFKDITPVLNNPKVFQTVIDEMGTFIQKIGANVIVAPEARGFVFASALAYKLGLRLVLIRKPNKLPRAVYDVAYDLEYGQAHLQMHQDAIKPGDKVVIVDDVLATGGTLHAIEQLVKLNKGQIIGVSVLIDLKGLHEPDFFAPVPIKALIEN